ncbi:hypothetical protein BDB00DRAFT_936806, partial [Zychaea mexicana]|uniref:uncharacterized protein n=1 Tax=Zychaea mexicana TaxID=64656 RepID=UPI0022FE3778
MGGSGSGRRQLNGTPAQSRNRNIDFALTELSLQNDAEPAAVTVENDGGMAYKEARDRAALETFRLARESRPANIINQYSNRQKEFKEWCIKMGVSPIPDDGKLHLFLKEEVAFRAHRKRGKKRAASEDVHEPEVKPSPILAAANSLSDGITELNTLPNVDIAYEV